MMIRSIIVVWVDGTPASHYINLSSRLTGLGKLNLDYGKRGGLSQQSFRLNNNFVFVMGVRYIHIAHVYDTPPLSGI